MRKTRNVLFVLLILLCSVSSVSAQVSIGIGLPNVSIGINIPLFPELVPVPGYPVYYAPRLQANYFFYDGMYWVYQNDNWYASSWYNGPWGFVEPEFVPLFILRVPVSYYRLPPVYFSGWHRNAPPRWGEHWGRSWEQRRHGWDQWKRGSVPARAPLPAYQRRYTRDKYPSPQRQRELRSRNYRYEPRTNVVRQHFRQQAGKNEPAPSRREKQERSQPRSQRQQQMQHQAPHTQGVPAGRRAEPPPRAEQRSAPVRPPSPQRAPERGAQREQHAPGAAGPGNRPKERREPQPGQGRGQGEHREEGRGGGRNN